MPALITMNPSPLSPLVDANMNVRRTPHDKNLKFPPGLGYGGLPAASVSSPALISPTKTRKRSGSVAYPSGCTFASGPNPAGGDYNPYSLSPYPRLGKRSSLASGLCQSWQQQPYYRNSGTFGSAASSEPQSPSRSHASSQFFEFSTPNTNFDPFADEQLNLPPASSTSYSHYWEYDPSTNGPKLRLSPPPASQNLLASPRPRTAKLPSATSPTQSRTRSSSPPQPVKRITSPPASKPDKDARCKLLAGILLNRIYAVGKPMRRRLCLGSDFYVSKEYVKSGLSRAVSIDC